MDEETTHSSMPRRPLVHQPDDFDDNNDDQEADEAAEAEAERARAAPNMNRAFDALFAAAELGDSSVSAMIEAKMAQSSSALNAELDAALSGGGARKRHSIARSRNGSFRSSRQSTGSVRRGAPDEAELETVAPNEELTAAGNTLTKKAFKSSLKTEDYLGECVAGFFGTFARSSADL